MTSLIKPTDAEIYRFALEEDRSKRLAALHERFKPHTGQIEAGKAIFSRGAKRVFLQCGRSWGKSMFATYCAVRVALLHDNVRVYVVFPERNQAQEVIWESNYIRDLCPEQYLGGASPDDAFGKSELRARFGNGSFVKLLGSDNPDSLRGPKPHFVVFDEFRDFKSEAYDIMGPNLHINNATLVICSTPPDSEGSYTKLMTMFREEMKAGNSKYFYLELPTATNPHFPKDDLVEEERLHVQRGEYAKYRREYLAEFIPGGASAVFRKFVENKKKIVRPKEVLDELIGKHKKALEWYCAFDPATTSTFAVVFAAVNRQSGQIFVLDEIYERNSDDMSPSKIWERARKIKNELFPFPERWTNIYDEQAAFFLHHLDQCGDIAPNENLEPTSKASREKEVDITILKDLFATRGRIFIADHCEHTVSELENYHTDEKGEFIKRNDHTIDDLRYILAAANFEPFEVPLDNDPGELDARISGGVKLEKRRKPLSFKELFKSQTQEEIDLAGGDVDSYSEEELVELDEFGEDLYGN